MRRSLIIGLGVYLVYGLTVSLFDVEVTRPEISRDVRTRYHDYRGSWNVDSDPTEALLAAEQLQYEFLSVSALNGSAEKKRSPYYSRRTLIVPAHRLNHLDARFLLIDLRKNALPTDRLSLQTYLTDILSQKAPDMRDQLLLLAHPLRPGFQWPGSLPIAIEGVEILNMRSMFERAWKKNPFFCLWSLLIYPFHPRLASLRLFQDPVDEKHFLQQHLNQQPVVITSGQDDIAAPVSWIYRRMHVMSVYAALDFMSQHVWLESELTGTPDSDALKLLNATKLGQSYLSVDALGDPTGFVVEVEDRGQWRLPTSRDAMKIGVKMRVLLPRGLKGGVEVAIFKDGLHFLSSDSAETEVVLPAVGTYQVSVYVRPSMPPPDAGRWMPWIFANPVRVAQKP